MKQIPKYTLIAGLVIAMGTPAFAANPARNGGHAAAGRPVAARPQISHVSAPARSFRTASFHAQPRVVNRTPAFNHAATSRTFAASRVRPNTTAANNRFTQNRVNNAAVTNARFARNNTVANNAAIRRNTAVTRNTTAFNRTNRYGGNWFAANAHSGWSRGGDHYWNHHHYRWYDGGWLIVDNGFWPFDYADPYPYYGDGYGYQPAPVASYSGNSVALDVQSNLAQQGYYNGPIDGDIGPMSQQAIANYQSDQGLAVTGNIDGPLLQSLGLQ